MSTSKSSFFGKDKAALRRRDFIRMQGPSRTRKIYILFEDGKQVGQTENLKAAQRFARS